MATALLMVSMTALSIMAYVLVPCPHLIALSFLLRAQAPHAFVLLVAMAYAGATLLLGLKLHPSGIIGGVGSANVGAVTL